MEDKELQSTSYATDHRSRQNSTGDMPNESHPGRKGSFLKKISIKRSKKENKDAQQGPVSPEKKEVTDFPNFIGNKLRSSIRSRKKSDGNSHDKCENTPSDHDGRAEETIPEIKLLSVMEINGLINEKRLEEAFQSIKLMEQNLMEEHKNGVYKSNTAEYKRKAKDVDMLYDLLFKQVTSVVKDSLVQQPVNEQMVKSVVYVINEEAKTKQNMPKAEPQSDAPLLGIPRKWKCVVEKIAVERISSVSLSPTSRSWPDEHLESLKKNIVEDLSKVKNWLEPLYPKDYDVLGTYVRSFHGALSSHLERKLLPHLQTFNQLHTSLNWILNVYTSDSFMGHPDFQQHINVAKLPLLKDECLRKLKSDYQTTLQATIKMYVTNILTNEKKKWEDNVEPGEAMLKESSHSHIYMDIEEMTGEHVRGSAKLSTDFETPVFHICMVELSAFSKSLVSEFTAFFKGQFTDLFVQYLVIYVNSFIKLRNNPNQSDEEPCTQAVINLDKAVDTLKNNFFQLFQMYMQPYFKNLINKKWLSQSTEFNTIIKSTKERCQHLKYTRSPLGKDFANGVHKHLVKGYLKEIMKRKMMLTNRQRKKASQIMNQQSLELSAVAQDLGSELEYLFPVLHCISDIICLSKKEEIQVKLEVLYQNYPDISEEHVHSVLHLQGIRRSKKSLLMNYFRDLQRNQPQLQYDQSLFSEIENSSNTTCF